MAAHHGTFLYLIKEREHVRCGDSVYKVGMTTDFKSRARAYPNNSIVLLSLRVHADAGREAERNVLRSFQGAFKQRRDCGSEYFEGLLPDMMVLFMSAASRFGCDQVVIDTETLEVMDVEPDVDDVAMDEGYAAAVPHVIAPTVPPPDAMQLVVEIIGPRVAHLAGMVVSAAELFAEFVADAGHHRSCPRMATFVALVIKLYGAKTRGTDLTFPRGAEEEHESAACKLRRFLTMDDHERGFVIRRAKGHVTWTADFRREFEAWMGMPMVLDRGVLTEFGFSCPPKRENVCKGCKQIAKSRGGRCCPAYNADNRTKVAVIFNMACSSSG
jgi:hypothetical protein